MIRVMLTGWSGKVYIIICGRMEIELKEIFFSKFKVIRRISTEKVKDGVLKRLKCLGCVSELLGTLRTDCLFPI